MPGAAKSGKGKKIGRNKEFCKAYKLSGQRQPDDLQARRAVGSE